VFTCLHDYHQALLFFTIVSRYYHRMAIWVHRVLFNSCDHTPLQCVTTPSMAISAVMVAAFKKYILVSLLKYGKVRVHLILQACAV